MNLKITVLIDNANSWIVPYAEDLIEELAQAGHTASLVHKHNEVSHGDVLCLLSCEKKFTRLNLNRFNLIVHESDLPLGRGMSPFTWQIVEGRNVIVVSLLEATDEIDAGKIYKKLEVKLNGMELVDEWRALQAKATNSLIKEFVNKYPKIDATEQFGEPSYYRKRTIDDCKLDVDKSIHDQFNLLRVVDNERYPAWFELNGEKFIIKISKAK